MGLHTATMFGSRRGGGTPGNSLAYSADAVRWTGLGASIFISGLSLVYAKGFWLASGTKQSTYNLAYSTNGLTWTGIAGLATVMGNNAYAFAYGNNTWVATGNGLPNSLAYSRDGFNWTGLGYTVFTTYGQGAAYGNGVWVTVGVGTNTIAYSSNAIAWTGLGTTVFSTNGQMVAYSTVQGIFVAAGYARNTMAYSTDGVTWTGRGIQGGFSSQGVSVACNQ